MDDIQLVQGILSKDKKAFYYFIRTYTPKLRRRIAGKITDPKDAEEVLQDTLFACIESIRDFHRQSSIATYLYAICSHKIVDYYRRKKIRHAVFSRIPFLDELVSPLIEPEESYEQGALATRLHKTFDSLMPHYSAVLRAKYEEGRSVEDIAAQLAISFKSAESILFRARKAFVRAFLRI